MDSECLTKELQREGLQILSFFHDLCCENDLNYILDYGTLLGAIRHQGFIPWDDDVDVAMTREDFEKFENIILNYDTSYFLQTNKTDPNFFFTFAKLRKPSNKFTENGTSHFDIINGAWIDIFIYDKQYSDIEKNDNMITEFNSKISFIRKVTPVLYPNHFPNQSRIKTIAKKIIRNSIKVSQKLFYRGLIMRFLDFKFRSLQEFINDINKKGDSNKLLTFSFPIDEFTSKQSLELVESAFTKRKLVEFENLEFFIPIEYEKVLKSRYGDFMKLPEEADRVSNHEWEQ